MTTAGMLGGIEGWPRLLYMLSNSGRERERAVAVAKELDIPLFVIPAPDENLARPARCARRAGA